MKKVKLMLATIAALSVVGGAVAFKAKRTGGFIYCTTTNLNAAVCSLPVVGIMILNGTPTFKYITVNVVEECNDRPFCTKRARVLGQ